MSLGSLGHAEELAYIDIYYGGEYLGSSLAHFNDSKIRFDSPQEFLSLLPASTIDRDVGFFFSRDIPFYTAGQCTARNIDVCFRHTDENVIVTFEPEEFAARIFIRPSLLVVQTVPKERYLHPYQKEMTYSGGLFGIIAASDSEYGPYSENYNLELRQLWSLGHNRFNANMGLHSREGRYYVGDVSFVHEESGDRIIVGRQELRGNRLTPNTTVTGFSVGSTTDLRLDLDQTGAAPIDVYLGEESRVELRRDGQLLSARNYPAGNHRLDVSDLPEGAYELDVRVLVNGQLVDELHRYFIKSTDLPARGEYQTSLEFGGISDRYEPELLENGGFFRLGLGNRIRDNFFTSAGLIYTQDWLAVQPAATLWLPGVVGELTMMAADDGYRAGDVSLFYQNKRLGSFGLGWFKSRVPYDAERPEVASDQLRRSRESTESAHFSHRIGSSRWAVRSSFYLNKNTNGESWSAQGSLDFSPFSQLPDLRFSLQVKEDRRDDFSAGLEMNYIFSTTSQKQLFVRSRERLRGQVSQERSVGVSGVRGSENDQWRYGLSLNDREDSTLLRSYNQYKNNYLRSSLDVGVDSGQSKSRSAVASFQTSFTSTAGNRQFYQGAGYRSGIIVSLDSDLVEPVDLFINDTRRIRVYTGSKTFIPLQPYKIYQVRLQPTSGLPINYDLKPRKITLYPGTVPVLSWQGQRIFPAFGQITVRGLPLGEEVKLRASSSTDSVENGGYFVLDIEEGKPQLAVFRGSEKLCSIELLLDKSRDVQDFGELQCTYRAAKE